MNQILLIGYSAIGQKGSPAEQAIDLDTMNSAVTHFTGTAREAARGYPKNANVAATIVLAGRVNVGHCNRKNPNLTTNAFACQQSSNDCWIDLACLYCLSL